MTDQLQAIYEHVTEAVRALEQAYPKGGEVCVRLFRVRDGSWQARISPKPPEVHVAGQRPESA
jgi:hypothetical protein